MTTKTILLVEDNPDDVELTIRALRKNRVANRVVIVRDGAEAVDWLFGTGTHAGRDVSDQPAVILMDIKMPKIDGLEVLAKIRADPRTRRNPVVMLTSSKQQEDVLRAYDNGANSYIRKPVDFDRFTEAIRQIGLYWMVLNELPVPDAGADA